MKAQLQTLAVLAMWGFAFHLIMLATGVSAASADQEEIVVRVLLYSGQPDPTYTLEDRETIDTIRKVFASAKTADGFKEKTVIPSILGYKGVLVVNEGKRGELPSMFAVYQGKIEVVDGQKRFFLDEGKRLEKLLIDGALRKGVVDDAFLKSFEKMK
jgi:hypothetical protein